MPKITVSGLGVVTAEPELIRFTVTIANEAPSNSAVRSNNNNMAHAVVEVLKQYTDENSIKVAPPSTWAQRKKNGKVSHYCAENEIEVQLHNTDALESVVTEVASLNKECISITNIKIDVEDATAERLRDDARKIAYDDAKAKAQLYCDNDSLQLIGLSDLTEDRYRDPASRPLSKFAMAESRMGDSGNDAPIRLGNQVKIGIAINAAFEAQRNETVAPAAAESAAS